MKYVAKLLNRATQTQKYKLSKRCPRKYKTVGCYPKFQNFIPNNPHNQKLWKKVETKLDTNIICLENSFMKL